MLRPDEVREVPAKAAAGTVPGYRCAVLSNAAGIQVWRDRPGEGKPYRLWNGDALDEKQMPSLPPST